MNSYFKDDSNFKKSSASEPFHCVEVAISPKDQDVAVRQSADPGKTTLVFTRDEWDAFVKGAKKGEFDLS